MFLDSISCVNSVLLLLTFSSLPSVQIYSAIEYSLLDLYEYLIYLLYLNQYFYICTISIFYYIYINILFLYLLCVSSIPDFLYLIFFIV